MVAMKFPADKILLIATRQIGDVLLCTPLLRSIRNAYPNAHIEMLVFARKGGMLEGNPDLSAVIEVGETPNLLAYLAFTRRIFRHYDLVVSTQGGDRPFQYACLGAPKRVCIIPGLRWQDAWKRYVSSRWTLLDNEHTHTVVQNLRLADLLEIPRCYQVVPPSRLDGPAKLTSLLPFSWQERAYVVMHPLTTWRYKRWTREGWLATARYVLGRGIPVVLTGGPNDSEREFVSDLTRDLKTRDAVNTCGQLTFGQMSTLLSFCAGYVGPDTSVTHLAAACGCPTLALFGPTNPVKWGPWPCGYALNQSPYDRGGALQQQRNVWLLQGVGDCVPCHGEGCERHRESHSRCLDELPVERVLKVLGTILHSARQSCAQR